MNKILYFKKSKDIFTEYGNNWDFEPDKCLALDDNFNKISLSLPERRIDIEPTMGQGNQINVTDFFSGRTITGAFRFKGSNRVSPFTAERDIFLNNWIYTKDDIYLIKHTEVGLSFLKGFFKINDAEKYKSFAISDELSFDFVTEEPFFQSVVYSIFEMSGDKEINFLNTGLFCSFIIEFKNFTPFNVFEIIYKDKKIKFYLYENGTQVNFVLNFENFTFTRNRIPINPLFEGESFFIEHGGGQFKINCQADLECSLKFRRRFV